MNSLPLIVLGYFELFMNGGGGGGSAPSAVKSHLRNCTKRKTSVLLFSQKGIFHWFRFMQVICINTVFLNFIN